MCNVNYGYLLFRAKSTITLCLFESCFIPSPIKKMMWRDNSRFLLCSDLSGAASADRRHTLPKRVQ